MATYITTQDLYKTLSDLDSFDLKKPLQKYDFALVSGIVYELNDAGNVQVLYRDGEDLGAAQSTVGGVSADGSWFYDADEDKVTLASTDVPNTHRLEFAPQDWEAAKDEALIRASEEFNSLMDLRHPVPLPKAIGQSRDYDRIIIKITSILAVIDLMQGSNPASPKIVIFERMLYNSETENGYIDRLNRGEIKFSWEVTDSDRSGEIVEIATDASTTGYPTDPQGTTTVLHDVALITIDVGGTLASGTENATITYSVTNSQGSTIVDTQLITGFYQTIGFGITARFMPGVYVAGDQWNLTVTGTPGTTSWSTISLKR